MQRMASHWQIFQQRLEGFQTFLFVHLVMQRSHRVKHLDKLSHYPLFADLYGHLWDKKQFTLG